MQWLTVKLICKIKYTFIISECIHKKEENIVFVKVHIYAYILLQILKYQNPDSILVIRFIKTFSKNIKNWRV